MNTFRSYVKLTKITQSTKGAFYHVYMDKLEKLKKPQIGDMSEDKLKNAPSIIFRFERCEIK